MSAPSSTGSGLATSQSSILSEKVHRALQVRTDTPAMKAALEALAHLPQHHHHQAATGNSESKDDDGEEDAVVVDSRSVRVAIEQDALSQALLLQNELQALVDTVAALRRGVTETATIADRLRSAIHTDVTVHMREAAVPSVDSNTNEGEEDDGSQEDDGDDNNAMADDLKAAMAEASAANKSVLEEAHLARTLRDAFVARDQAKKRLQVVQAFLEKFDLKEQDSRLLDHYNFEDMMMQPEDGGVPANPANGMAFLDALQRVVHIRQALSQTFGPEAAGAGSSSVGNESNQLGASSALRMMESLAQKQEQAYERLYHWLQQYLNLSGPSTGPLSPTSESAQLDDRLDDVLSHPFCKKALQTLHHVPAFYAHTLELIANARRSQATKHFLLALTSGHAGMPPIEMKAHDSVAYVGDMLAFCFRSFSVEADFAKGLRLLILEQQRNQDSENDDDEEGATTISTMPSEDSVLAGAAMAHQPISAQDTLALTMSGVARPLKSRILQVISTLARSSRKGGGDDGGDGGADDLATTDSMDEEEYMDEEGSVQRHKVTQLYEICGLLLFYASAMENTVQHKLGQVDREGNNTPEEASATSGPSPLMKAVLECLEEATNAYEATLRVYAAMLEQLSSLTGDPEASLAYSIMNQVTKVRVASPGFSSDVACPKQFRVMLSLDFALEVTLEAALSSCKSLDDAITLQSAITLTQEAGLSDPTVVDRLTKMVEDKESSLIEGLVAKETVQVLDLCGLGTVGTAWKRFQQASAEGGAHNALMAAYPGLSPEEMQDAMKEFYKSLYSPPLPSLEKIKEYGTRKAARRQIAQRVCLLYGELYQAIMDEHQNHGTEAGGYTDVSFLGHSPEQVSTLFTA